jgi:O-antigen/teichoic acid export membrane protein
LSNFVVSVVAANALSASGFGAFALAFVGYVIALGISRSLATDALLIRHSDLTEHAEGPLKRSLGGVVVVGIAAAVLVGVLGLATRGALGPALLALAASLPGVLLQDGCRQAAFARGRPLLGVVLDASWLLLTLLLILGLHGLVDASEAWCFLAAWGVAGGLSGLLGILLLAVIPSAIGGIDWLHVHRDIGPRLLAEFALFNGSTQVTPLVLAVVATMVEVGGFRGAQVLLGPVGVLTFGALATAVPELARVARSGRLPLRLCDSVAAALAAVTLAAGVALHVLPDSVGTALLGDSWARASDVVLPLAVASAGSSATIAYLAGLRAHGAARQSLRAAVFVISYVALGGSLGALAGGAFGGAVGLILPMWAGALRYRSALKKVAAASQLRLLSKSGPSVHNRSPQPPLGPVDPSVPGPDLPS